MYIYIQVSGIYIFYPLPSAVGSREVYIYIYMLYIMYFINIIHAVRCTLYCSISYNNVYYILHDNIISFRGASRSIRAKWYLVRLRSGKTNNNIVYAAIASRRRHSRSRRRRIIYKTRRRATHVRSC